MLVCNRLYIDSILVWLFLAETIIDGLAIAAGDTTLVSANVPSLLVNVKYIIAMLIIPFLCKFGIQKRNVYLCILPVIYWIVLFLNERSGNIDLNILMPLLLSLYCLMRSECKKEIFQKYRIYIIIMSCIGILTCMSVFLPIGIPYKIVPYYGNSENAVYIDFTLSYVYLNGEIPRLCGLFNEPGYMGTVSALVLIADECNLRKWGNLAIFVAGMFTLSLAFFVLIILYFIIHQIKHPVRLFTVILFVSIFLMSISNIRVENPAIQSLIERFDVEDGKLSGDNRTSIQFDIRYHKMFEEGEALFGMGTSSLSGRNFDVSSYKTYIFRFGLVGYFILFMPLLIVALFIARKNMQALFFVCCFFISLYQRPHVYAPTYFVILFGGLYYIISKKYKII